MKLSGQYVKVYLDDSDGDPHDVSTWVESIDIPQEYAELDATGFSDGTSNSIPGMPNAPIEITGSMDTTADSLYQVLKEIIGTGAGSTLTVQVGQYATPTTGDPEFEGEFWCSKFNYSATPAGKLQLTGSLRVYGTTPAAWGTVSA